MNVIDIIIVLIICYFGYRGYKNGLVRELASLIALVAGIFLSIRFSDFVTSFIENKVNLDPKFMPIIAFGVIFIAVVILVLVFSKVFDKILKIIKLQWLNKMLGIVFGLSKILLILGGLFFLITEFIVKLGIVEKSFFLKSICISYCLDVFMFVFPYIKGISSSAGI